MVETSKWNGGRFVNSGRWRWLLLLVVVSGSVVALGLTTRGGSSSPSSSGLCKDKLTQMEHTGTMATMLQQHQNMMEQMRAALSPQMQQRMDTDPMWQNMRSGDFTQMMQEQQQQIVRMLGSTPTCGAP